MTEQWICEVADCGKANDASTPRCAACGAIRGETVAPPRSQQSKRSTEYTPAAERKRNMVFFYIAIWIPIAIWIMVVFFAC